MNNIGLIETMFCLYKTYFCSWIKTSFFGMSYLFLFILGSILSFMSFSYIGAITFVANIIFLNRQFMKSLDESKVSDEMKRSFFALQSIALYTDGFFFGTLLLSVISIFI